MDLRVMKLARYLAVVGAGLSLRGMPAIYFNGLLCSSNFRPNEGLDENRTVIADFVCPTEETRKQFNADYTIWMDTIKEGRFDDTNKMFEQPTKYDFKVGHMDASMWAFLIKQDILDKHGNLGPHR